MYCRRCAREGKLTVAVEYLFIFLEVMDDANDQPVAFETEAAKLHEEHCKDQAQSDVEARRTCC